MKKNRVKNLMPLLILVSILLLWIPVFSVSAASVYYVATTGNDATGTGSYALPYKTLQKAVNVSSNGDTIYILGGLYRYYRQITIYEKTGADWLTICNYDSTPVYIDGANIGHLDCSLNATIQIQDSDRIRITGLIFNHSANGGVSESIDSGSNECSYIRVDNCSFLDNGGWAFKANRGSYIWFDDNVVTNNFCNWHGIPGADMSQETISYSSVDYGYVRDNTLWKNHCENIDLKSGCTYCQVTGNIINTTGHGATLKGAVTYNGGIGVYVDCIGTSQDNILINGNLIFGNTTAVQVNNEGAAGHYSNIVVSNNVIHINQSGNDHGPMGRIGVLFCVDGTAPDSNHDLVVKFNTIYMSYTDAGHTWGCVQTATNRFTDITIANNILALNITSADAFYGIFPGITLASGVIRMYNNVFEDFYPASAPHISYNGVSYHESDTTYFQNGYIFADPLFHSRTGSDFNINISSPCIANGTSSYTSSYDFIGTTRPQGGTYDIGAYEYDVGETIPPIVPPPPTVDPQTGESQFNGVIGMIAGPLVAFAIIFGIFAFCKEHWPL